MDRKYTPYRKFVIRRGLPLGIGYFFHLRVNWRKTRHNFADTLCECNQGVEDTRHFLFECPR